MDGKGKCVGRKPAGEEMGIFHFSFYIWKKFMPQILWVLENFQFVAKLWFFNMNRYGRVCLKVIECFQIGGVDRETEPERSG